MVEYLSRQTRKYGTATATAVLILGLTLTGFAATEYYLYKGKPPNNPNRNYEYQIIDPEHQTIISQLRETIVREDNEQNQRLALLEERSAQNMRRLGAIEDRLWAILMAGIGAVLTSAGGAYFSWRSHTTIRRRLKQESPSSGGED